VTPSEKIAVIHRSLRCRRFGFVSLIPFVGIIAAIFVLRDFRFVRGTVGKEWNPARRQLNIGMMLATLGVIISFTIFCAIAFAIVSQIYSGYDGGFDEY
jgi:hypothetical protein